LFALVVGVRRPRWAVVSESEEGTALEQRIEERYAAESGVREEGEDEHEDDEDEDEDENDEASVANVEDAGGKRIRLVVC